jgi:hypothetical protein
VVVQLVAAVLILPAHAGWTMLFVGGAVATFLACVVIEPTAARAASRSGL